ncbi:MAG: DnaJ domain-containing protein [Oligoflexia bacterium]|nr:DnaJ domain-containing protein [Oligoflexia bacterium]
MSELDLTPQQMQAIDHMFGELEKGTSYGLLNIASDATPEQVRTAYYRLSRQWHPDRFFRKEVGEYADRIEMVFVGITQAYQILKSPEKRKAYDRDLRQSGRMPEAGRRPNPSSSLSSSSSPSSDQPSASPGAGQPAPASEEPASTRKLSIRERLNQRAVGKDGIPGRGPSQVRRRAERKVREQLRTHMAKAKVFFEQGQKDYRQGRIIKAAGALELAVQFDPRNAEYKNMLDLTKAEARRIRVQQLTLQGGQAESYQQYRQAIQCYRDAVRLDPDDGKVFSRLARLVRHEEQDDRGALNLYREAVVRDPDVIEYRMVLGKLYADLGLKLNARREYLEVLKRDKGNEAAKAGLKAL